MNDNVNHPSHYTDGKIEVWKPVSGFENYQISNFGRIKNTVFRNRHTIKLKERMLTPSQNGKGYMFVYLSKNGKPKMKTIHRLVAEAFIENPNSYPVINHKDGNKENNFVDNLEWCTVQYNAEHSHRLGLQKPSERQKAIIAQWDKENHSKPVSQYAKNGAWIKDWEQQKEAELTLGLCRGSISQCVNGRAKTAGGFIWKRK